MYVFTVNGEDFCCARAISSNVASLVLTSSIIFALDRLFDILFTLYLKSYSIARRHTYRVGLRIRRLYRFSNIRLSFAAYISLVFYFDV